MTKKYLVVISALLALSLLAGCGGGSAKVKNDVPVGDIATAVASALGNENFLAVPDYYYAGSMQVDISKLDSYTVMQNSKGTAIDEFGILKAKDAAGVKELEQTLRAYLQARVDAWTFQYTPEEFPKLENSEVKTLGNYVMFVILFDEDKATAFDAFEKALTA
jgi:hypothetical protein